MLNRDRKEVIDALIKWACEPRSFYGVDEFMEEFELSFNANTYDDLRSQIIEWLNSEYDKPFKITRVEKYILESLEKDITYIKRDSMAHLRVYDETFNSWEYFSLFDHIFEFIKCGEPLEISDILRNCEVVD